MTWRSQLLSFAAALTLAGCVSADPSAMSADNGTSQRAISADIDASLNHGPTSGQPGMKAASEQIGALPSKSDTGGR